MKNVEKNQLSNVSVFQKALSDEAGSLNFYLNDPANPGSLNMGIVQREDDATCISVDAELLSEYVSEEIDLLKLDIEGAEENVLLDLYRSGRLGNISNIACEYHHHIQGDQDRLSKTLKMLEDAGFGYQIPAYCENPPCKGAYQDLMIYAYKKSR